jgi:hypothetical protein
MSTETDVEKERRDVWSAAVVAATRRPATFRQDGVGDMYGADTKQPKDAIGWADLVLQAFDRRFVNK